MRQVLQNIQSGELSLETVPPPALQPGGIRVRTAASLLSAGTEKMLIDLAQKSLVGKARARPDLVRQVLTKVKKEGLLNTYRNVQSKMEKPMSLGYSAAGIVEAVGAGVQGIQTGDRVAIAGAGYANHAEVNFVPKNLAALIPDGVTFEEAAYTTVASIALQGVRLARPELGDNVVVIGLGLIGLITVQLLQTNGCRVLGIDLDARKVALGRALGMDAGVVSSQEDPVQAVERFTRGRGADHTLITAATKSNGPIELAGELTRRKGQVVAVGAVGMQIPRDVYYKKELEVKLSMSYGPGRYDPTYEEGGIDYPYDYVRWTEQRNMEAVLDLMARGRLDVTPLTSHRFAFDEALDAYGLIKDGREPYVGIVLEFDVERTQSPVIRLQPEAPHAPQDVLGVGFVGAGNYAALHLLPHLQKDAHAALHGLVTATGLNAQQKADKFGFRYCTTELDPLLEDPAVDAVFIATRHSTHADFAARALRAGKHVFVEKPMVVTEAQLEAVAAAYRAAQAERPTGLMVGLNRRFAPMVAPLREAFPAGTPRQMIYRVNSGPIPTSSWLHEPDEGGGMLVGEMCHFIDLMQYVAGERPVRVYAQAMSLGRADLADHDNVSITVTFDGGSVGTLCYSTVGDKAAPKERLEVYGGGTVAVLDDFRRLEIVTDGRRTRKKAMNQDKGQARQLAATVEGFRARGQAPIPFEELVAGMQVVFAARRSLASGEAAVL
ncbi:MAG: bi-domain-containing oxidoreductase [Rhodothermales bacterium]|nr:bi-domain-containing oxidoreductase [Rhodothermales bacterium]